MDVTVTLTRNEALMLALAAEKEIDSEVERQKPNYHPGNLDRAFAKLNEAMGNPVRPDGWVRVS